MHNSNIFIYFELQSTFSKSEELIIKPIKIMNRLTNVFINWIAYAAIITLMCGIIYITVQQNFRMNANDPQYQMVEDAANTLSNGADPKSLIPSTTNVEISKSLAPFFIIYDDAGNIAATNATLNGKPIKIPAGVITYIQKNGSDAASWQPQPGVRQAMVGLHTTTGKGYIVVAGRSLRKVEERIALLGEQVLFGWVCSLVVMFVIAFLLDVVRTSKTKKLTPIL